MPLLSVPLSSAVCHRYAGLCQQARTKLFMRSTLLLLRHYATIAGPASVQAESSTKAAVSHALGRICQARTTSSSVIRAVSRLSVKICAATCDCQTAQLKHAPPSWCMRPRVQGVCHRDLKLENTLLDGRPAPRLKICDFG